MKQNGGPNGLIPQSKYAEYYSERNRSVHFLFTIERMDKSIQSQVNDNSRYATK